MSQVLLEVKKLKTYIRQKNGEVRAVDGVDFSVKKGETLAIVGESGCGKSMTSLSIMGLLPKPNGRIVEGEIVFSGINLVQLSDRQLADLRGRMMSMIFQEPMTSLNPVLTIGRQLQEVLRRHLAVSRQEARQRAVEMLKKVGFARPEQILKEYPHRLSGGMRQRVMIAMAMACEPELLIADEPTTALDVTIQAQILDLMKRMKREFGSAIILITHDLGVVAEMADRVLVMYAGQVLESASAYDLFTQPKHPYTAGLLESTPRMHDTRERLTPIPGNVPSAADYPDGCRFAARCPRAVDSCRSQLPELREVAPQHFVRCSLV
ncbi:ABC transporter ATP-binding protein [Effusibacillus pohliae]|uniref:ABC transporter ATP-binding protein n=1 Tax=Effusibacillus pohliae TaxID=232270 RepID=UPI00036D7DAA|nr:ABC transporter ATP-binding protein [Effusibacillus pohliae]